MRKLFFAVVLVFLLSLTDYKSTAKAAEVQDKVESNQTNDDNKNEDVSNLSTEELINTIIDGELLVVTLYDDIKIGINSFINSSAYYKNLIMRNDLDFTINYVYEHEDDCYRQNKIYLLKKIIDGFSLTREEVIRYVLAEDVYTPNRMSVPFVYRCLDSISNDEVNRIHQSVLNLYPDLYGHCLHPASYDYNCHSYAWYSQNHLTNKRWLNYPNAYILDYSYEEVTDVRPGDLLCYWDYGEYYLGESQELGYYISHSAIVVDFTNDFDLQNINTYQYITLRSKWGRAGVYEHSGSYCPYFNSALFQYVKAYRPRVSETIALSNPSTNTTTTITKTKVIPENASLNQNYALYELNVSDSIDYSFNIQSTDQLRIRLYTIYMQALTISLDDNCAYGVYTTTFSTYLLSGTYYLRVSFQNINSYGTITTSIDCAHYHNFNSYVWRDLTFHNSMCTLCGPNAETHVVSINEFKKKPPKFYTCMICGGPASAYTPFYEKNDLLAHTINGSLLLPNGIIILVDEDLEAYLDGKLYFVNDKIKEENIVLYLEKKEQVLEYL